MTHLHLAAAADGGLLATTHDARFAIDLPAERLSSPKARAALRGALAGVVDDPVDWAPIPAEPRPWLEILLPGQPRRRTGAAIWWSGGAWYGARGDDVEAAIAVLRTGAPDKGVARAWSSPSLRIGLPRVADPRIDQMAAALADLDEGWLLGNRTGEVTRHRLVPWPDLDPITGVCRRISVRPGEPGFPSAFRHLHATLPRTELSWPGWQADRLAPAAALVAPGSGEELLQDHVVASAVAHLAGPWCQATTVRRGSPDELRTAGVRILEPALLAAADPALGAHPDSPLAPIRSDRDQWWVPARRLADGKRVWAPMAFTHTYADPPALPGQPVLGYHNLAGVGAARTVAAAVGAGLRHVLSHDAVARWWRAADALVQLASARDLLDPDGLIRHSGELGAGEAPGLLPPRPRRDYLDCAPARPSGTAIAARPALTDAMAHLQAGLDPRVQGRLRARLADPARVRPPSWPGVAELVRRGASVHVVRLTPPPLSRSGWHAVRVLVPGCLRLEPAAFPVRIGAGSAPEQCPYPGW